MNCETARAMMESNDPGLTSHLSSCPVCVTGAHAPYYPAPSALEQKIRKSLKRETQNPPAWRLLAVAAGLLLMASLAWNVLLLKSRIDPEHLLASNVVSAHIRSLSGTHLMDVPSSDQHNVKPWFNGKLDFSPPVPELEGFPLLGGRLEYFDGRPAAAVVYSRAKHIVNVFIWPSSARSVEATQARNGFHIENWSANDMTFWVVSDLNEAELRQFVSLYRQTPP